MQATFKTDEMEEAEEPTLYEKIQQSCGCLTGAFIAWLPCIGCFCCCKNPYYTIPQGSKGLVLRYNKYIKTVGSGLFYANSITEEIVSVDCRVAVLILPSQRLMTKDNISITVQSCVYYNIKDPHLAVFRNADLEQALSKICGGIIKNTITMFTFQELLEKKQEIAADIATQIAPIIKNWGIVIDNVCLKNFNISAQLQSELVSAPIARRNAEAMIINAHGQVEIARLLGNKSKILDSKTAIQVRYLEVLKGLARNGKSKMIYRAC